MRTRSLSWIWLTIAVSLLSLGACRPIEYYLTQVYKVHGRVTVAGSDPAAPIGSVEVRVGAHQYSELTNYYGDYEMELPDGAWTITFSKEGYEPQSMEVAVGSGNPRQELDAELVWIAPPFIMTGYWAVYADFGDGEEVTPHLIYFEQNGAEIEGWDGDSQFTVEIVGSTVTIQFEMDGPEVWTGTLEADGKIYGAFWWMERPDFTFGSLELHGIVELESTVALGQHEPDRTWHGLSFAVDAAPLMGELRMERSEAIVPDAYDMEGDDGHAVVIMGPDGWKAELGSYTLDSLDASTASGSFDLFEEEGSDYNSLRGTFNLGPGGAGVTITSGRWYGAPVVTGTTANPSWWTSTNVEKGRHYIVHLDNGFSGGLELSLGSISVMKAESYAVPGEVDVIVFYDDFEDQAISGTLVIDS